MLATSVKTLFNGLGTIYSAPASQSGKMILKYPHLIRELSNFERPISKPFTTTLNTFGSLSKDVLSDPLRQPEVNFSHSAGAVVVPKCSGKIVSLRIKTLSSTHLVLLEGD